MIVLLALLLTGQSGLCCILLSELHLSNSPALIHVRPCFLNVQTTFYWLFLFQIATSFGHQIYQTTWTGRPMPNHETFDTHPQHSWCLDQANSLLWQQRLKFLVLEYTEWLISICYCPTSDNQRMPSYVSTLLQSVYPYLHVSNVIRLAIDVR